LRVVGAPLVENEVVVGADARRAEFDIVAWPEGTAGETAHVGKTHLRPDTFGVHVFQSGRDVVASDSHIAVTARVHTKVGSGFSGDRVEGEVPSRLSLVDPGVVTVGQGLDSRGSVAILGGQPVEPDLGVLDDVVVDRDDL
jgi:hypothetical protein